MKILTEVEAESNFSSDPSVFEATELASVHSDEGIKVRAMAKQLLTRELGLHVVRVVRQKLPNGTFGPPEAHLQSTPNAAWMIPSSGLVQLSLSHDGRFLAVAAVVPTAMTAHVNPVQHFPPTPLPPRTR